LSFVSVPVILTPAQSNPEMDKSLLGVFGVVVYFLQETKAPDKAKAINSLFIF
jgi:hypothetical protein